MWAEDPEYDRDALAIAEGRQDRLKQDALYVRLARDGGIASLPAGATYESIGSERERASRIATLADSVLAGHEYPGLDYDGVEELLRALFDSVAQDAPDASPAAGRRQWQM